MTEKFSSHMANKFFTPLNILLGLNKKKHDKNSLCMIDSCLQNIVFTVHNFFEMSKIRRQDFVPKPNKIIMMDKLDKIFELFKEEITSK